MVFSGVTVESWSTGDGVNIDSVYGQNILKDEH